MATERRFEYKGSLIGAVLGLVFTVIFLIGMFYIAQFVMRLLWYATPLILIALLIIDYRVPLNYLKWLGKITQRSTLGGVALILLSLVGLPLVSLFLLGKALLRRRVKQMENEVREQREGRLIDYEELESEPLDLDRLKEAEQARRKPPKENGSYDQFFE